jgi:ornithine--oxo-acid transaminase
VWDIEGKKYLDCLAAYSAVNQGHRHPAIVEAAKQQVDRLTLTSRAFHNDQMGPFLRELCELAGYEKALPMNSGAEAVETAIKAVRRWGYRVKGIPADQAEIVVCSNNFHGRTTDRRVLEQLPRAHHHRRVVLDGRGISRRVRPADSGLHSHSLR